MDGSIPDETTRAAALGDPLTRLLDERRRLLEALLAVDDTIYQVVVNRLQGQIGAVLEPLDRRVKALERRR